MGKFIYLDNAATTQTSDRVIKAMLPYYARSYGNPSSIYDFGEKNKKSVAKSREIIADAIHAKKEEIYFTSGGSEADNWALQIAVNKNKFGKRHMITTKIEHHAILNTCKNLEKQNVGVTYLNVDESGMINLEQLKSSITPYTKLISIMYANNEIGTIEPIREIGKIARENKIIFHTDAVQAFGHLPIDVEELNIDMMSASAHKFNGPKGVGFLYVREGIDVASMIFGGGQERGKRAGTENVPGIVGMGEATKIALERMEQRHIREVKLRDYLIKRILTEIPYTRLNGSAQKRLANNINVSFQFVEGDNLLVLLDMAGICASVASACSSSTSSPSHVLNAIGLPDEIAYGTLRMTLSEQNTVEELDYVAETLKYHVKELRAKNSEYEEFCGKH
ncbi:cysteine desulfurase NifS [Konateibacter massiliensis]|uniref:cysteine desulfurase NifS n=1 Tax=Konateibacter massiliensis TaxID=2002841 RepID=UPI000C15ACCA|nr:cysteine desulfurase NifS [Konateibacter massiliensis]